MRAQKRKMLFAAIIIAAVIIIAALIVGSMYVRENRYSRSLSLAEKYMEDQDYNHAILAYLDAVEAKPKEVDTYISLVNVYHQLGRDDYARQILERGIEYTESAELMALVNGALTSGEKSDAELAVDEGLLILFAGRSYGDYRTANGIQSQKVQKDGSILVRAKSLAADLIFRNTEKQTGAVSGSSVAQNARPDEIHMDDIMQLFGGGETLDIHSLEELNLSGLRMIRDESYSDAVEFTVGQVMVTVACSSDGRIGAGAQNRIVFLSDGKKMDETDLSGTISDAQDGSGISHVKMVFRKGTAQSGASEAETETDTGGDYKLALESGPYTVELSCEGYTTEYKDLYVNSYGSVTIQDFVMSREVSTGEVRIVLSWGASPRDLDSWLVGRADDGTSVRVNFMSMHAGSAADLDLDDTDGYGPETITIHNSNGSYHFFVMDYTRSGSMHLSDASVTVYLPGQSPVTIDIDGDAVGQGAEFWDVCNIDHGKIEVINSRGDRSLVD